MSDQIGHVRVGHGSSVRTIPIGQVYFPFASGRLEYDCPSCGAKCCRGHGYIASASELRVQLHARSQVRFFIDAASVSAAGAMVHNLAPACFFLTDGAQCSIQENHGFAAKPVTCRLFPFNRLQIAGDHLIVWPHPTLCPLRVVSGPARARQSRHDVLLDMLMESTIGSKVRMTPALQGVDNLFEREREIVRRSDECLDAPEYYSFVLIQLAATASKVRETNTPTTATLKKYADLVWDMLGEVPLPDDVAVVNTVTVLTPLVRSLFLWRADTTRPALPQVEYVRLPYLLLSLYVLALLAKRAGAVITYQTISQIAQDMRELLVVLAYADCPVTWRADTEINLTCQGPDDHRLRYIRVAKALLPACQRKSSTSLAEIIADQLPQDPVDRIVFLKRLATRLAGCITTSENGCGVTPALMSRKLQRWALGYFSDHFVAEALGRYASTPSAASAVLNARTDAGV